MAMYRDNLPQLKAGPFICYTGLEVNLIFKQGVDLPGFASFPLVDTEDGRTRLRQSYSNLLDIARTADIGAILQSTTWMANRDRAAAVGYGPHIIERVNRAAMELLVEARNAVAGQTVVLSGNVGPRDDAYAPSERMSATEAEAYHDEQIGIFADTEADLVTCHTLAYVEEAIGVAKAARGREMPVAISFTVETDGHLPTGEALTDAITRVDDATGGYPAYYMINCAHPDHFTSVLEADSPGARLKGLVVNASRRSHQELNEAKELDEGDPKELGAQLAELRAKFPQVTVVGGCCGTDVRHLTEIAMSTRSA